MKTKKLLLALPMVAILAGCSSQLDVYRDMFKDARSPSDETKAAAQEAYGKAYVCNGEKVSVFTEHSIEVASFTKGFHVDVENDEEGQYYHALYTLGEETIVSLNYDIESGLFNGTVPEGTNPDHVFNKFRDLVFDWNGHVKTGVFDVAPYQFDTKLLNVVSRKTRVINGKVSSGNFALKLQSPASYTDGENLYTVTAYQVSYSSHLIRSYSCSYNLYVPSFGISVANTVTGTFEYGLH